MTRLKSRLVKFASAQVGFVLAVLYLLMPLQAGQIKGIEGPAILTVTGKISNWNRLAFNKKRDTFHKFHDIEFDKAMQFDRAMLSALEQGTVNASPPQIGKPSSFSGPRVNALLKAVGAGEFKKLRALGLDGFAVEIAAEDVKNKDWIMALSIDGKPLSIGDQGPIWLMHTPTSGGQVDEQEEQSWPWAVFYLHIE